MVHFKLVVVAAAAAAAVVGFSIRGSWRLALTSAAETSPKKLSKSALPGVARVRSPSGNFSSENKT